MTSSSFIAGEGPLPDDVASAFSTCVAAMTQLRRLVIHDLSLHVIKTLVERTQPLEDLTVGLPGVNWVSVSVFCQCAHIGCTGLLSVTSFLTHVVCSVY